MNDRPPAYITGGACGLQRAAGREIVGLAQDRGIRVQGHYDLVDRPEFCSSAHPGRLSGWEKKKKKKSITGEFSAGGKKNMNPKTSNRPSKTHPSGAS